MTKPRPPWRAIWTIRRESGKTKITIEGPTAKEDMKYLKRILRREARAAASRSVTVKHLRSIVQ